MSSYDGHLRKLNEACKNNTDDSRGESGGQVSLISWHHYIGIPINLYEESGIVTFLSIELSATLDVSKGCEALCPERWRTTAFSRVSTGVQTSLHLVR